MFRYSAFGLSLESELEIQSLHPCDAPPEVRIREGKIDIRERKRRASADVEFAFSSDVGRFEVTNGRDIVVEPAEGADSSKLRSMLLGRVMGYLMKQRGWLPLHASAVLVNRGAALFLGDSGMGKSTTAAAFEASGHRALSDEVCAIRIEAGLCQLRVAGAPLRLMPDALAAFKGLATSGAEGDKHAIGLSADTSFQSASVRRIYVLDYGERLDVELLPRMKAVQTLSLNAFVNARGLDAGASARHLHLCASVAESVPVGRLVRQRSLERLVQVVELVEQEMGDSA